MSVLYVCNIDMDMDSETIKDKIFRYFNGKSDYATEKEIFEYISSGEKAMDSYRSLEKEWKSHNIPTILQRQSFDRITARIKARKRNRILKVSLFSAAAALALDSHKATPQPVQSFLGRKVVKVLSKRI